MRVTIIRQTDVVVDGRKQAVFRGQSYDLPPETAQPLIDGGWATEAGFRGAQAAGLDAKAVEGPPQDKALKPIKNKRRRR